MKQSLVNCSVSVQVGVSELRLTEGMVGLLRPQFVLFGDSITEQSFRPGGWGTALADTYSRKADIVVRGYGGYNTRWALFLLNHLFPLFSGQSCATPPAATTIFFGANDAALQGRTSERQHVPVDEYRENLRKIIHHLKECSPSMVVVLITAPPVDEKGREEYAHDGLHLTAEGNAIVHKELVEVLKDAGFRAENMLYDFPHHSEIDGDHPEKAFCKKS
ncbi:GDSL esterase/lipase [Ananas comosus]|uniref:GDSL esterase/lipase n=1 Tax=Ananas comosus TaxID=4615 RepID=A0A199UP32_ANACO|nr:GDSL esterase/lipase [Ananas comosus]